MSATLARHTVDTTRMVPLNGREQLLHVVEGRSESALPTWGSGRHTEWAEAVTVAALDPFRGYATALSTTLGRAPSRVLDACCVQPEEPLSHPPGATVYSTGHPLWNAGPISQLAFRVEPLMQLVAPQRPILTARGCVAMQIA